MYIIGHAPPGADERLASTTTMDGPFQDRFNRRYLQIVRRYSNIISGQFFGHLHSDTFRVIYNEIGEWYFIFTLLLNQIFLWNIIKKVLCPI